MSEKRISAFPVLRQLTPMFYDDDARRNGDTATHYEAETFEGMELRDYFAAKALQGFVQFWGNSTEEELAKRAYMAADAMLAAREKVNR